jgi:hypothetical protein
MHRVGARTRHLDVGRPHLGRGRDERKPDDQRIVGGLARNCHFESGGWPRVRRLVRRRPCDGGKLVASRESPETELSARFALGYSLPYGEMLIQGFVLVDAIGDRGRGDLD